MVQGAGAGRRRRDARRLLDHGRHWLGRDAQRAHGRVPPGPRLLSHPLEHHFLIEPLALGPRRHLAADALGPRPRNRSPCPRAPANPRAERRRLHLSSRAGAAARRNGHRHRAAPRRHRQPPRGRGPRHLLHHHRPEPRRRRCQRRRRKRPRNGV
eukprot:Amastigsp_a175493_95.p4 type:complete len:155 gc:universal Amastigsp_a175493_95:275-739(+)